MSQVENPLRKTFWTGSVDPRPLALFRIGMGLLLLQDLLSRVPDRIAFYSNVGVLPAVLRQEPWRWSLVNFWSDPGSVTSFFIVGAAVILALTVGFHTRPATLLTWLFLLSLHNRNGPVGNAGDDLARNLLFFSLLTDTGACWSVDARARQSKTSGEPHQVPAFGLRLMQLLFALLYFAAGYFKVKKGWLTGQVLYQALQLYGFLRPPGVWLMAHPALCHALNNITMGVELGLPVLAFLPFLIKPARAVVVLLGMGFQLGLAAVMCIPLFTAVSIWTCVLFIQPVWLDAAARRARKRGWLRSATLLGTPPAGYASAPPRGRGYLAAAAAGSLLFCAMAGESMSVEHRVPASLLAAARWLYLVQHANLFSRAIDVETWSAPGLLADGRTVDVLYDVVPELRPGPRWAASRWYKLTFDNQLSYDSIASFLCRSYNQQHPAQLVRRLTLQKSVQKPTLPGQAAGPPRLVVMQEQLCL